MYKFFKKSEFACKCGCGNNKVKKELIQKLDKARGIAGVAFHVNSGYRCASHNKAVGGVASSAHTAGYAADIKCSGPKTRLRIVRALLIAGFNRIGIYDTFVHADISGALPQDVIWLGDNK